MSVVARALGFMQNMIPVNDPYFASVSLLLHMDGANNSTTFTDSSSHALTMTAVNAAKLTTTNPKFGSACGTFINGTNHDRVTTPANALFNLGTGAATIEFQFNSTDTVLNGRILTLQASSNPMIVFNRTGTNSQDFALFSNNGTLLVQSATATGVNDGNWHHVEFDISTSSGTNVYCFVDGNQSGSTGSSAAALGNSTDIVTIGSYDDTQPTCIMRLDEFRITKGVARHTAPFVPQPYACQNQ
jgi:Concanavalin A-like lectin/glucanases superfamily